MVRTIDAHSAGLAQLDRYYALEPHQTTWGSDKQPGADSGFRLLTPHPHVADDADLGDADVGVPGEFPHFVHAGRVADGVVDRGLAYPRPDGSVTMRVRRFVRLISRSNLPRGHSLRGRHHEESTRLDSHPGVHAAILRPCAMGAQDVDKDKAAPKTLKAQVEESIGWYQVFVDASGKEPMKPQAVLRWGTSCAGSRKRRRVRLVD